jgi:hypothetical protein
VQSIQCIDNSNATDAVLKIEGSRASKDQLKAVADLKQVW